MKRIIVAVLASLFAINTVGAQSVASATYWVQLKDKKGTLYSIDKPGKFLSQRAIDRRVRQNIAIDETDLPVSSVYIDSLKKRGLEIIYSSKWLNGVTVRTADSVLIKKVATLPFVKMVQLTKPADKMKSAHDKFADEMAPVKYVPADYGKAIDHLTHLNGQYLHNSGFRGKGVHIAVLDAGFLNVNTIEAFDSLRLTKRIVYTRDFVNPKDNFYAQHYHGMSVLSCMGGNLPGKMIGTAPDASYYLFRTEDVNSEYLIEGDSWTAAAELADSLGVDVINSSLGYNQFDDKRMDYSFADLNGSKSRVTQAANMAFKKGILVFSSAGNEGNKSWKRIVVPSDGENVICVGAIMGSNDWTKASFSSVGPAYGGAVKPNVVAMGAMVSLVTQNGQMGYSNGTSFSSPILAGLGACLLQSNPYATAKQLKAAIEQSAHQFSKPDSLLGYGVPDFAKADKYLKVNKLVLPTNTTSWAVSPNPFTHQLFVRKLGQMPEKQHTVSLYSIAGECLWQKIFDSSESIVIEGLAGLPNGFLVLSIRTGAIEERFKLVKTAP